MFTNILMAVDGSEASLRTARKCLALASALKAQMTVVAVTVPWSTYFARELAVVVPDILIPEAEYEAKRNATAAQLLRNVEADARDVGVTAMTICCNHRNPWRAILDVAERERCDLILMPPHHESGFPRAMVGGETMKVLSHTIVPVLVYRELQCEQRS